MSKRIADNESVRFWSGLYFIVWAGVAVVAFVVFAAWWVWFLLVWSAVCWVAWAVIHGGSHKSAHGQRLEDDEQMEAIRNKST